MKETPNQFLDDVRKEETRRVSQLVIASIDIDRLSTETRAEFSEYLKKENDNSDNIEELISILRTTTLGREVVDLLEIDLAGNKISMEGLKQSLREAFGEDLKTKEQPAAA